MIKKKYFNWNLRQDWSILSRIPCDNNRRWKATDFAANAGDQERPVFHEETSVARHHCPLAKTTFTYATCSRGILWLVTCFHRPVRQVITTRRSFSRLCLAWHPLHPFDPAAGMSPESEELIKLLLGRFHWWGLLRVAPCSSFDRGLNSGSRFFDAVPIHPNLFPPSVFLEDAIYYLLILVSPLRIRFA